MTFEVLLLVSGSFILVFFFWLAENEAEADIRLNQARVLNLAVVVINMACSVTVLTRAVLQRSESD